MVANKLNKIKEQSGRSMVEMIGALFLVALLFMAAVKGVSWSFERQHANELSREIMERAADIKMQLDRPGAKVRGSKWEAKSHTGCLIDIVDNSQDASIEITNVKKRVCEMVYRDLSHLEGVSRMEANCEKGDNNNTMVFYFEKLKNKKIVKQDTCFCDEPKVCDEDNNCICPENTPTGADADTCECPDGLMPIKGACLCPDESEPVNGVCGGCNTNEECGSGYNTCENHICTCVATECPDSDFTDTLCACCPSDAPKWDSTEGVCKTCADIDITLPVYNKETKMCEACPDKKVWDSENKQCVQCIEDLDCAESGFVCDGYQCICAAGTSTPCAANLIQTVKTSVYEQMCYICGCPSGSTMSGSTCVCNNECQTYNTSTKTCINKTDGTACSSGVCSGGICTNDTCPSGTSKSCSANLVVTQTAQTASGTLCYTCGCPSDATLSGSTCVCNNECQTYDTSIKTCVSKEMGTVCSNGLCKYGSCTNDTCPNGTSKSCAANLVATASSKTAYGTQCYTCGCPSGSTMSGSTCVCNSECQTYNTSTKTCTNKTNGTTCTNGLCSGGVCKNDTCPSGSTKSCSANLVATASSKTAYGTQCYTCGCPSGSTLSSDGTTCVCNNECQTYNASTKTCVSKTDGTACTNGLCKAGTCASDTCPTGTSKSCSANLVATASSKTAYGTQCYTCGCPSGSTLSGTTCVCSNECQTYNTSTKTCTNKTNGTTCSSGLCKNGTCTNDTCPSGTSKSCASGMTATLSSTTAYGTSCYTCSCPLNYTLTNGTCVANSCSYNTCSGQYYCLTNKVAQGTSCTAPSGGVCTATTYRTVTASGKTYYVSNREFTYWDAVSFCRSLGKTLIAPSDLASDYVSGYENYTVTLKPLATAIKNLGIKDYLWTTQQGSIYGTSCYRVEIGSANAFVYEYNIRGNDRQDYAVCK